MQRIESARCRRSFSACSGESCSENSHPATATADSCESESSAHVETPAVAYDGNPSLSGNDGVPSVAVDRLPFPHPSIAGAMLVRLTQGRFAVIDAADAEAVGRHTWCAAKGRSSETLFYAATKIGGRLTRLHRFLWSKWGLPPAKSLDHRDGNALDCRRGNIRPCTQSQNAANSKLFRTNTSGFKGVNRDRNGRWFAAVCVDGARKRVGTFATPEEASVAYLAAAQALYGEFARAS